MPKVSIENFSHLVLLFTHTVKEDGITQMKLQKLVYLCQAFHCTAFNEMLFENLPEGWVHGPVYRDLYTAYQSNGYNTIPLPVEVNSFILDFENKVNAKGEDMDYRLLFNQFAKEKLNITDTEQTDLLYQVLDYFSEMTASELRNFTHQDEAWIEARQGLSEFAKGQKPMNLETIKGYFKKFLN